MDVYQTPKSKLIESTQNIWRPLWLLILCHLYYWPKLLSYVLLYVGLAIAQDYESLIRVSINIPVYIAIFCYLFKFKLLTKKVWKIWVIFASLDEIVLSIQNSNSINELFVNFPYYLIPLYVFAGLYAFGAKEIWNSPSKPDTVT